MSVWADMHRRSNGESVRKEDIPIREEDYIWWGKDWYGELQEERRKKHKEKLIEKL